MPRHPSHIGGAPVDVTLLIIKDIFEGHRGIEQVSACGVQNAFGFPRRARGVKNKQRVFGIHGLWRTFGAGGIHKGRIIHIAPLLPIDIPSRAFEHHHMFDLRTLLESLIGIGFERNSPSAAHPLIRRDDIVGIAIVNASGKRIRSKAAKHHRMNRANTGACQHRHRRLHHHRHVDGHAIALAHAQRLQAIGKTTHLFMQLPIGDMTIITGFIPLMNDGNLIASCRQVPIHTIGTDIQHPVFKPADMHRVTKRKIPHFCKGLHPIQTLHRLFAPEVLGVTDRFFIQSGALSGIDESLCLPLFFHRICVLAHVSTLPQIIIHHNVTLYAVIRTSLKTPATE